MQPLRQLGRYALFGEMAKGGMANVHLGRLLGSAGFARTVVIKRMKAELAEDDEFVAMFVDEARLASRIQHPNVVSTLDVVRHDKELFIVLEYVHGKSLDELITATAERHAVIPPRIVSALGVQALLGLHAAHEATSESGEPLRLVHRDFTPHNLMVDVDGAARVVDFGVAMAAQKLHKTREGQVKGKWAYMSPEQVAGEEIDRRSDIFAAGIVLWEALTCRRLFFHENPARIATDITFKDVEPPSRHGSDCPEALDRVVLKALEKEPGDRFATAREMAQALRKAQPPTDVLDVSGWLDEIAGDALAARAREVAAIEKASSNMVALPKSGAISLIDSGVTGDLRDAIDNAEPALGSRPRPLAGGSRMPSTEVGNALEDARETRLEGPEEIVALVRAIAAKSAESAKRDEAPATPKVPPASKPPSAPSEPPPSEPPKVEPTSVSARRQTVPEAEPPESGPRSGPRRRQAAAEAAHRSRIRVWVAAALLVIAVVTVVVLLQSSRSPSRVGERGVGSARVPAVPATTTGHAGDL